MGSSHPRNSTRRARRPPPLPDLYAILGRLDRTRSFFTIVLRSLKAEDRDKCSPEAEVLEEGLAAFNAVYDELDLASGVLHVFLNKLGLADRQLRRVTR